MVEDPQDTGAVLWLAKLLPLLAAWEPALFAKECLRPSIEFLVKDEIWETLRESKLQGESNTWSRRGKDLILRGLRATGRNIEALGTITREVAVPVLPLVPVIFRIIKRSIFEQRKCVLGTIVPQVHF
jgi:hypothetical protein